MKMIMYHLLKDYDVKPEMKHGASLKQQIRNTKLIMTPRLSGKNRFI